jgi:WD40 repeat protein
MRSFFFLTAAMFKLRTIHLPLQVWAVAFRPDGARLASVSDDRCVCIYDCA